MLGSAGTFGTAALELPSLSDTTIVVTSDLRNFSGLDRFAQRYPDRFFNVGIAEQNMVNFAAGFASEGFNVYATTYATFATARSADSVRVNMGYMGMNVKLFGLGAGFSVGALGPTHISVEDISIARSIPNLTVISPADCIEAFRAVTELAKFDGPAYIRLGGNVPHSVIYESDYDFQIGKAVTLREGKDVAIVGTGSVLGEALSAAEQLEKDMISVGVYNMHTVKPLDVDKLQEVARSSSLIVTLEEHTVRGGLGSAVLEELSNLGLSVPSLMLGISDYFPHAGSYPMLLDQAGLSSSKIISAIRTKLG